MTPAQALEIARAQDAYGKWNTAPAWNRYYELKRASQSPLRRLVGDVAGKIGLAVLLVVSWAPIIAPVLMLLK